MDFGRPLANLIELWHQFTLNRKQMTMYIKSSLLTFRGNDWCVYTTFFKQVCMYTFSRGLKPSIQNPDTDFLEFPPLSSVLARFMLGKYLISIKFRKSCSLQRQVLSSCMPLLVGMQPVTCSNYPWNNRCRKWSGQGAGTGYTSESWYIFYSKHYLTYSSSFSGSILTLRTLPTESPIKAFDHQSLLSTKNLSVFGRLGAGQRILHNYSFSLWSSIMRLTKAQAHFSPLCRPKQKAVFAKGNI